MTMYDRRDCQSCRVTRSYRRSRPLLRAVLLLLGLTLMFLCIPGWAWAALAGILLIIAGYVLISLSIK